MGRRIIREYWCDTCGESFSNEHDFYHKHLKYTGGNELDILEHRITNAKNQDEAFGELCDWFGFHSGEDSCNIRHAYYNEDVIRCIIQGMREGRIHNDKATCECECSAWYKSAPDVADFIEESIPKLKEAYNTSIDRAIEEREKEMASTINILKSRKL